MKERMNVSTYLAFPSNAWVVAAIYHGHLVTKTYMGYTKREAIRQFRAEMID